MALKPEFSVMGGLAVAALVYGIHANFTPTIADIQGLPAGNKDVDAAERKATWVSAGAVSAVSLQAKDPTILVMGSAMVFGMAFFTRQAAWTDSKTGLINAGPGQSAVSANDLAEGPSMQTKDYTMYAAANDFVR